MSTSLWGDLERSLPPWPSLDLAAFVSARAAVGFSGPSSSGAGAPHLGAAVLRGLAFL